MCNGDALGGISLQKGRRAAVKHSFRALEATCPRPGEFHPHFHVLLVVPGAYLEPHSPLYITQEEWAAMWRKALGADGERIIDIRVTENHGEVAKYVTKPGGYLELIGEQWQRMLCDPGTRHTHAESRGRRAAGNGAIPHRSGAPTAKTVTDCRGVTPVTLGTALQR